MHSDPIADLLTRIRNGAQARLTSVDIPHSKIKVEIVKILEAEGYNPEYHEYAMPHSISPEVIRDLVPWLQKTLPPKG